MNEQEALQAILVELKTLNKTLSDEQERQSKERENKALQDVKNQEVTSLKEQETKDKEIALQKLEAERFEKIEKYIQSQNQENTNTNDFRAQLFKSLDELDQTSQNESLIEIGNKLNVLVESSQITDKQQEEQEVSHFTDLTLLVFFLAFVPAFLAYKGLTKLFDSAFA